MLYLVDDVLGTIGLPHWNTYRLWLRRALHEDFEGRCGICREPLAEDEVHVDHIEPRTAGGSDAWANLQPVHMGCNSRKGGFRKRSAIEARVDNGAMHPTARRPKVNRS